MKEAYQDTSVAKTKSQEQIEKMLRKFGVQAVRFTSFSSYATLEFVRKDKAGKITPYKIKIVPKITPYSRNPANELERAERQVWRVAYWWLKSKIEAVDFGLVEFEEDFLPYMLLNNANGETGTVAQLLKPRLNELTAGSDFFGGLRMALPPPQSDTQGK